MEHENHDMLVSVVNLEMHFCANCMFNLSMGACCLLGLWWAMVVQKTDLKLQADLGPMWCQSLIFMSASSGPILFPFGGCVVVTFKF